MSYGSNWDIKEERREEKRKKDAEATLIKELDLLKRTQENYERLVKMIGWEKVKLSEDAVYLWKKRVGCNVYVVPLEQIHQIERNLIENGKYQ